MNADVLITNAHVYDPGAGIDWEGNVAVFKGKILSLHAPSDTVARQTIDATDCLVVPGLIDLHTHDSRYATHIGLNPDIACIPNGVTMVVDCGSSGVSNYRAVLRILNGFEIRTRLVLHVSAGGQMMTSQFVENCNPSVWDVRLFEDAFEQHPNEIVGLKIRASKEVLDRYGKDPVAKAVQLADHLGTRLFVHATNCVCPMSELVEMLRPGDVVSHIFQGEGNTVLSETGRVGDVLFAAQKKGIVMDVAQGQGNLSLVLAKECIAEGFIPDTVSTDLNIPNWRSPLVFSLLMTMTKMMALGMSLEDVILGTTTHPAKVLGLGRELGTLREGTTADISVLKIVKTPTVFKDKYGNEVQSDWHFEARATIVAGNVQFQHPETLSWK